MVDGGEVNPSGLLTKKYTMAMATQMRYRTLQLIGPATGAEMVSMILALWSLYSLEPAISFSSTAPSPMLPSHVVSSNSGSEHQVQHHYHQHQARCSTITISTSTSNNNISGAQCVVWDWW